MRVDSASQVSQGCPLDQRTCAAEPDVPFQLVAGQAAAARAPAGLGRHVPVPSPYDARSLRIVGGVHRQVQRIPALREAGGIRHLQHILDPLRDVAAEIVHPESRAVLRGAFDDHRAYTGVRAGFAVQPPEHDSLAARFVVSPENAVAARAAGRELPLRFGRQACSARAAVALRSEPGDLDHGLMLQAQARGEAFAARRRGCRFGLRGLSGFLQRFLRGRLGSLEAQAAVPVRRVDVGQRQLSVSYEPALLDQEPRLLVEPGRELLVGDLGDIQKKGRQDDPPCRQFPLVEVALALGPDQAEAELVRGLYLLGRTSHREGTTGQVHHAGGRRRWCARCRRLLRAAGHRLRGVPRQRAARLPAQRERETEPREPQQEGRRCVPRPTPQPERRRERASGGLAVNLIDHQGQPLRDLRHGRPLARALGQHVADQPIQDARDRSVAALQPGRLLIHVQGQELAGAAREEGRLRGHRFIQHDAQGINIGLGVHLTGAAALLRRKLHPETEPPQVGPQALQLPANQGLLVGPAVLARCSLGARAGMRTCEQAGAAHTSRALTSGIGCASFISIDCEI